MEQMTLFDWMPTVQPEPEVGEYVTECGAVIPHIMRPSYIGSRVLYDCSTQSRRWYRVGILEKYIPHEGRWRSVIYYGKKQRSLVTHYPGVEIFECLPWEAYQKRMEAIYGRSD